MTRRPQLLDVIELVRDLPEANHRAGDQGTIVEVLTEDVFLVEFAPTEENIDLHDVRSSDLRVVWRLGDPLSAARSSA